MKKAPFHIGIACLLVGMASCKKDTEAPEAPPVSDLRTYDMVPITVERIPSGYLLECKRALSDPQAAYAQLLDTDGDPVSRIDFNNLGTTIENITFDRQDIVITDVLPWGDGTYLLCGFGIETQRDDRLHAVVYRVDERGTERSAPIRRFIGPGAELVRNNDLNELYRTRVLAVKNGAGDLVLAARYETSASALIRLLRVPMGTTNTPVWIDIPLTSNSHRLQYLGQRTSSNDIMLGRDVAGSGDPQVLEISTWTFSENGATAGPVGIVDRREATATAIEEAGGQLRITGTYDSGFDEPRTFHASGATAAELTTNTVNTDGGRAAISYASSWSDGQQRSTMNTFESGVLGPEAERNDRISDLGLARMATNGELSEVRTILPGQGARAIGCFNTPAGTVIIGALHPFLNTDYLHTFYLVEED
ncbi:MAG: hypothetical protein JNL43_02585 [Flavobacteriales bacterium]|nr:hypothetical protein [Flavobacteriales bacterium]